MIYLKKIDTFPEQPSHLSQGSDHSNNDSSDFITVTYDRRGRLMKPSINPDDKTLSCQSSDDAPSVKEVVSYLPAFEPSEPAEPSDWDNQFKEMLQRNQEMFENSQKSIKELLEQQEKTLETLRQSCVSQ